MAKNTRPNPKAFTQDSTEVISKLDTLHGEVNELTKSLEDKFPSKWGIIQGLIAALSILLAMNFGYSIWKSVEITTELKEVEKTHQDLIRIKSSIQKQAQVLTTLTESWSFTNKGMWFYHREQWQKAAKEFHSSIRGLEKAQESIRQFTEDLSVHESNDKILKSVIGLNPAIQSSLVDAYYYEAISEFFEANYYRENDKPELFRDKTKVVLELANEMIRLAPNKASGYHLKGFVLHERGNYGQEVIDLYEKSISLEPDLNPDVLNLAELYFVSGRFKEAKLKAIQYLKENDTPSPVRELVSNFILYASQYFESEINKYDYLKKTNALISRLNVNHSDFLGNYSLGPFIQLYEDKIDVLTSISSTQKTAVKKSMEKCFFISSPPKRKTPLQDEKRYHDDDEAKHKALKVTK